MPTISELRVRASYDGRQLKSGLAEGRSDIASTAQQVKRAADQAEAAVIAANTAIGESYAKLPLAARRAYDEAIAAQRAYQQKVTQNWQQVGMAATVGISLPFAIAAKEALTLAAGFEQNMNVLQASLHATGSEMRALSDEAVRLGADMTLPATSAVDAGKAMTQLAKGGLTAQQVLEAARGTMQLAAAAGVDASEAATIEARALAAFNLQGTEASHVADLLARASYSATGTIQDMGYAVQAAGAVMHSAHQTITDSVTAITELAKAGVTGADAGTSLKQMFLRLEEGGSMRRVRDVLHAFNIEIYDSQGRMKDMRGVIAQFAPMFDHLTEKQRNAALAIIFGSDAVRAANIVLGGGVKAFDAMKAQVDQQGAAAELAAARNKGLAGALDGLKSAWETVLQQSAEPFLKPLANMVHGFGDLLGVLGSVNPAVRNTVLIIGGIAAVVGPAILAAAALTNAWRTLFATRALAAAAAAKAAASEAAQAVAMQAQAVAATEAATAQAGLATAEQAAGASAAATLAELVAMIEAEQGLAVSGVEAAAGQVALAKANQTLAVSSGEAAVASAAASRGTGLLGLALGALQSPLAPVVLLVGGLSAALYALWRSSRAEAEAAEASSKALRDDAQTSYDAAKAKVELTSKTRDLLTEYDRLAIKTHKSNEEAAHFQGLANKISTLLPDLVKGYTSTGNAILDMARAHAEATKEANGQYDAEMRLAKMKLNIIDSVDAGIKAQELRRQGAGRSLAEIEGAVTDSPKTGVVYNPNVFPGDAAVTSPLAQALGMRALARRDHDTEAEQKATKDLLKAYHDINAELRQTEATKNELVRLSIAAAKSAKDEEAAAKKRAALGPEGYKKYVEEQKVHAQHLEWLAGAKKRAEDEKTQKAADAYLKKMGWGGIEDMVKVPKGRKPKEADDELTDDILKAMAKHVRTPAGAASCGFFAEEMLRMTGAAMSRKGYSGGAQDLIKRLKTAGGYDVKASEAKPGDLVYYQGPGYGAKDKKTGKRSGFHVGIYEGEGLMQDSSGEGEGNVKKPHQIYAGAHFIRPVRTGKYDDTGEMGLHAATAAEEEAKKKAEALVQAHKQVEEAFTRVRGAIYGATDAEGRYANMLGITLDAYKKLDPKEKKRAETLFTIQSTRTANTELERMKADAAAGVMTDQVDKGVAQFKNSLVDRKDLTDADKARLVDEKRVELVKERADEIAKEVQRMGMEQKLAEATTEQERIRLRLMMERPDIKPEELAPLAKAEYDKFRAEKTAGVRDELTALNSTTEAAKARTEHDKALLAIQASQKLNEEQRYRLIQDQNDALQLQLYILEQQARVAKDEITPQDAERLINAEKQREAQQRLTDDQQHSLEMLKSAQEAVAKAQQERMDTQAERAKQQAEQLADIFLKGVEGGFGKGMRGFWNGLVEGWRETIKSMLMEWVKSQLMRSFTGLFEGKDLRAYQKAQSDKAKQKLLQQQNTVNAAQPDQNGALIAGYMEQGAQAAAAIAAYMAQAAQAAGMAIPGVGGDNSALGGAAGGYAGNIVQGEYNGTNMPGMGGYHQGPSFNAAAMMASLAMLIGSGAKKNLLGELLGIAGLLGSFGAFNKGGFLSKLHFAQGGTVPYEPVMVGEYGPEIWMPPVSGGRVLNAGQTNSAMGGTVINVTQNISTPNPNSFRRSSKQMAGEAMDAIGRQHHRNFTGR